jgi:hypothetical protein
MQAVCKAVRKQSLCGSKPGGAEAYNLRESCVKKDRAAANAARRSTKAASDKMKELAKFYLKEISRLGDREKDIKDLSHDIPTNFIPGIDHRIVEKYIHNAKASVGLTVRARIKKACDEINRGLRRKLEFTRGLEMLVIAGAISHYSQAMKDISE